MTRPKILAVASAVDLDFRYGCTPAWWQLWKGLYETGVDLIVTSYRGRAVSSPWWRTYENPVYRESEAFAAARAAFARIRGPDQEPSEGSSETTRERLVRETVWRWVTPRWQRHMERILDREAVDAVVIFSVPMSHLRGIPTALRRRFGVPIAYYDGDMPMSLPEFGGVVSGFNVYRGADLGEYDVVVSNSDGGLERLRQLGAKRTATLFWAADPEFFAPLAVPKEVDVFFYGHGVRLRRPGIDQLIAEPSRRLPDVDFAVGGYGFQDTVGNARDLGPIPFSGFRRAIAASRINVNVTRQPHAVVRASSTSRLFELASAGAAIVSGPHEGIERWFEPDRELVLVADADEAVAAYRALLADTALAEELGRRARQRVLDEHTYAHRAVQLLEILRLQASRVEGASALEAGRANG